MGGGETFVVAVEAPSDVRFITGDRTIAVMVDVIPLPLIDRMDPTGSTGVLAAIEKGEGSS